MQADYRGDRPDKTFAALTLAFERYHVAADSASRAAKTLDSHSNCSRNLLSLAHSIERATGVAGPQGKKLQNPWPQDLAMPADAHAHVHLAFGLEGDAVAARRKADAQAQRKGQHPDKVWQMAGHA